ncbi:ATP-binding protein [Sulfitobacter aestuariivivens]|uniref:histidine kinase n=1 Tax=Sulfitobacter aestuariivivens TaxID=2766981 RepID=A0A927D8L3_9RHOB|nr:HAMP domain-containing sensor histidine kinase [Sulfitobacter aestuariivivens]MBD3665759.1 HAMP domain-containing histidine kinase [Sulfitobacter aestuariivivens]
MSQQVRRKWRPPLALIIIGAMAGIVALPVIGIAYFRLAGNILSSRETVLVLLGLAIVAAAILGYLLWRLVLRPVTALTRHARAMKAGRVGAPPPAQFGTPEFSDLGQSVIDMGETLHNRAAGVRAYADHVTHELKSPLTAITGASELLQGAVDDADRAALADTIKVAAQRMETLLSDLRDHAAAGGARKEGHAMLGNVAGTLTGIEAFVVRDGRVPMPAEDLHAVLVQLAQNATGHGATRLDLEWDAPVLRVADDGTGVAQGNQARIFDPFFTTTRTDGGTGMGLSIVRAMVEAHGGKIVFVQGDGGARFDITF